MISYIIEAYLFNILNCFIKSITNNSTCCYFLLKECVNLKQFSFIKQLSFIEYDSFYIKKIYYKHNLINFNFMLFSCHHNDLKTVQFLNNKVEKKDAMKNYEFINICCENNNFEMFVWYLNNNVTKYNFYNLKLSIKFNRLNFFTYIINYYRVAFEELFVPAINTIDLICIEGRLDMLKWLLQKYTFTIDIIYDYNYYILRKVCEYGHFKILKYLTVKFTLILPDFQYNNFKCFKIACENGHLNIVKWLITTIGISKEDVNSSNGFLSSFLNGHYHVTQWLVDNKYGALIKIRGNTITELIKKQDKKGVEFMLRNNLLQSTS